MPNDPGPESERTVLGGGERPPVVVGVDFSESSRRALAAATSLCERSGAPLLLLHVWNANHLAGTSKALPPLASWIAEQKGALVDQLGEWAREAGAGGAAVSTRVVEGVASRVLPDEARAAGAGLVVVGRRGSADLAHVRLGSVSERVVHQCSCPVLVVPRREGAASPPGRLLVGVDFSAASKDAYHTALALAGPLGADRGVLLLHVRPPDSDTWLDAWSELAYRGEYPYDARALERWAELRNAGDVPVALQLLEGSPEEVLPRAAEREDCDWLVLGLQGRTALASFLIGSTTDRVLRLADRPVLVVPMRSTPAGESTS